MSTDLFQRDVSTSMQAQTGWRRPHAQTVCQDWVVLGKLRFFVYELTAEFMDYCDRRMGLDLRRCECGFERAREIFAPTAVHAPGSYHRCSQARFHDLWELFTTAPALVGGVPLAEEPSRMRWAARNRERLLTMAPETAEVAA